MLYVLLGAVVVWGLPTIYLAYRVRVHGDSHFLTGS
jgi:hypothetical protein